MARAHAGALTISLLIAGCDRVFDIDTVGPAPPCLGDDFDTGTLSPAVWSVIAPASPTTVAAANGELAIALAPQVAAINGVRSVTPFDLTHGEARVELVEAPRVISGVKAGMFVFLDDLNYYVIEIEEHDLLLRSLTQGAEDLIMMPFDPVADRFWRIRHDDANDAVSFETSPDPVAWVPKRTAPVTVSLTLMRAQLLGEVYKPNIATPGTARFDNFRVSLPSCN